MFYGANCIRSHNDKNRNTVHAEEAAINKLPPRPKNKKPLKVDLLVIKTSKTGSKFGNSKPCVRCLEAMKKATKKGYKIVNVYYTCDSDGKIEKHKLSQLITSEKKHVSKYWKSRKYGKYKKRLKRF